MRSVRADGRGGDPQGSALREGGRARQESGARGRGPLARVPGPGALCLLLGLWRVAGCARAFEVGELVSAAFGNGDDVVYLGCGASAVGAALLALATASAHDGCPELAGHSAQAGALVALEVSHGSVLSVGMRKARTSG